MARVLVLNVKRNMMYETEVNNLEDYYEHLGVDIFDIARRKVGNQYYDIFVDDMGLFRDGITVSAINEACEPMLVGNLIFANHDGEGNTTSLSDEDIENIMANMVFAIFSDGSHNIAIKVSY